MFYHLVTLLAEAFLLSVALSLDAFIAGLCYGMENIRLPALSLGIIDGMCSLLIGAGMVAGRFFGSGISPVLTRYISFFLLLALGLIKLGQSLLKKFSCHYRGLDPVSADSDHSRTISAKEAFFLSLALSADGVSAGFGAALGNISIPAVVFFSLLLEFLMIFLGILLGRYALRKLSCKHATDDLCPKVSMDGSWLSGIMLILFALYKLWLT